MDQNYYLPDDILYKTDRMSMAHSLEVRPPFLDHRIVEFAASLPAELEDPRHQAEVPAEGTDAREAAGLRCLTARRPASTFPTHDWFRGMLRDLLLDTLTPEAIDATGIFDARAIQALIRDHMERRINVGYHLWGLLDAVPVDEEMEDRNSGRGSLVTPTPAFATS